MLEVIDAFVDGERVDPRALKDALSDPAGRDYFVEVWMLREGMQEDRESRITEPGPAPMPVAITPKRTFSRWVAAAALVAGVAGGYVAGYRAAPPGLPLTAPAPAPVAARPAAPAPPVFPAPQPTRVIQLEFQLDSSTGGGD